jgi:hypothetical protein
MDIAVCTRPDPRLQEPLRYMLRALSNVTNFNPDTDRVWVIGYKPTWLTNIEFLPGNTEGAKGQNIFTNWLRFARESDSDTFAAFQDDCYALRPTSVVDDEYRGSMLELVTERGNGSGWYSHSVTATAQHCSPDALCYELHRPVLMCRFELSTALEQAESEWDGRSEPPQWRSVYGNAWRTGLTKVPDVKVRGRSPVPDTAMFEPWLSTRSQSWNGHAGQLIRALYPRPSRYEL